MDNVHSFFILHLLFIFYYSFVFCFSLFRSLTFFYLSSNFYFLFGLSASFPYSMLYFTSASSPLPVANISSPTLYLSLFLFHLLFFLLFLKYLILQNLEL